MTDQCDSVHSNRNIFASDPPKTFEQFLQLSQMASALFSRTPESRSLISTAAVVYLLAEAVVTTKRNNSLGQLTSVDLVSTKGKTKVN